VREIGDVRESLEKLSAATPSDRLLAKWAAWALRLQARLDAEDGKPDALAFAERAVAWGERLAREDRVAEDDVGESATHSIVAGEIALRRHDNEAARRHWEHAADIVARYLPQTRNWHLLDPAVRAAAHLGRLEAARTLLLQLKELGYVPLEPWPETIQLDDPKSPAPKL
jgi:hypothetical protein